MESDLKTLVFATSFVVSLCATHVAASSDQTNSFGRQLTNKSAKAGASFNRGEARQGHVLADILRDRDIKSVAVTYSNTPYGISLETAFSTTFRAQGGTIAISISHQDGKTDYFAEMGALAVAGVEHLVVFGHLDRGGEGILRTALDTGAFEK